VPKLVCTKATREADPSDRPQKIRSELFLSTMLHHCNDHKEARSSSRPYGDCKVAQIIEHTFIFSIGFVQDIRILIDPIFKRVQSASFSRF
jgi:hypothetical protein